MQFSVIWRTNNPEDFLSRMVLILPPYRLFFDPAARKLDKSQSVQSRAGLCSSAFPFRDTLTARCQHVVERKTSKTNKNLPTHCRKVCAVDITITQILIR